MTRAYVGIGSNVDAEHHIAMAVQAMRGRFGAIALSPFYRNPAVGFEGNEFLNGVAGLDMDLTVPALKTALDEIESTCGRQRGAARFTPRTLDLDLLLYGTIVDPAAKLPRADILRYAFVLKPLADIAAAEQHPVTGRTYAQHWTDFEGEGAAVQSVTLPGL
jgi:2-amino-4-hydroxy-6-hydroxymethyldihydropteridine diphosphokinase